MSEISNQYDNRTNAVATVDDPFTHYAAKVTQQQGQFLTFKNGEFLFGQDAAELPLGTRLAANVAGLMIGWRRWSGGKVTDDLLEPLVDQRPVPMRNTLGDNDPATWEIRNDGSTMDPWQFTNQLQLADAEGEIYIYSTASKGGLNCIGQLCKAYGQEYRQRPGMVPIVELANDFYIHTQYGKTYVPVFTLVGWTDETAIDVTGGVEPEVPAEERPPLPQKGQRAATLPQAVSQRAANPTPRGAPAAPRQAPSTTTTSLPSEKRAPRF